MPVELFAVCTAAQQVAAAAAAAREESQGRAVGTDGAGEERGQGAWTGRRARGASGATHQILELGSVVVLC